MSSFVLVLGLGLGLGLGPGLNHSLSVVVVVLVSALAFILTHVFEISTRTYIDRFFALRTKQGLSVFVVVVVAAKRNDLS